MSAVLGTWRCRVCDAEQAPELFRGRRICQPCNRAWHKEHYQKTREEKLRKAREYAARTTERRATYKRVNRERIREWERNYKREATYGITAEAWDTLFTQQGNVCAICKADTPGGRGHWHTDHCHEAGAVRGILCHHCNLMLGNSKDRPAVLRAAATYLEKN